jgi:TP901 family phage tail tape measure protein
MAVATQVVARFTADISDVQSKMAVARGAFGTVAEAASFSSKRIAEVGDAMANVGKKMTVGITLPLGGVAAAASTAAISFEQSMNKIIGLVGIASDEVARMGTEVTSMAGAVGKSPDELANGLFVVTSAGLRGSEAMAVLGSSARAGAAGLGETNDIARAVAGALSAYGTEVLSASDATDAIVATARAGNFETSQFAASIGRVLPFAKQAGASFQEMGGAVALLTRVNGDAAQSVTQIQALFRAFVVPTEEAKTALDEVGMSAQDLRDSIAAKGLPATLAMLDKALGGNREQLGRLLGSSEAASAAFQILDADAATIEATFGGVRASAGMTAEAFAAVSQTTQFQMNQAMAQLKATLIDLGNQFLPIIKSVADFMQANLKAFTSLPGPIKTFITAFAGILAVIGPLLFIVGKLIVVFSGLLSIMLKMKAIGAMRLAFAQLRGEMAATRASMKQTQTSIGMLGTAANQARVTVVASFKAIGIAAKGLLASLGPIGLAMIAVGAAFEIFVGKAAGTEHHLANLRDEIDLTTGKMTEAAKIFIASELRHNISQEDLAMMENYGISISGFIAALEQGGPALDAYRDKFAQMRLEAEGSGGLFDTGFGNVGTITSMDTIINTMNGMIDQYGNAKLVAADLAAAQVDGALAASDAQRGLMATHRAAAQEQRAIAAGTASDGALMQNVIDATAEAVRGLQTAFSDLNNVVGDIRAEDAAKDAYEALTASIKENGDGFRRTTDEQRANRDALLDYIDTQVAFAESLDEPQAQLKALQQLEADTKAALKKGGVKPNESAIYKSVRDAVDEAEKKVGDMKTAVSDAEKKGLDVSEAIASGIEQGMSQQEATLNAAGAAAGDFTADGLNTALGISSPSRVAMDAGRNTGLGLIQGLNQMRAAAEGAGMNVGANVVRGMLTSLRNGQGPVASAAREIVAAAIAAARDESQEGSPSKVFMGIGRNMVLGLARGITYEIPLAKGAGSKLAKSLITAFREAMEDNSGSVAGAINQVFGSIPTKTPLEMQLGVKGAEKFIKDNKKALMALVELGEAIDLINAKVQYAGQAFASLGELVARPFGRESAISEMFGSEADIDRVIDGFLSIRDQVKQAYSVLTDASIVGAKAAARNRAEMYKTIGALRALTEQAISLRQQYDTVMAELETLEKDYQKSVTETNAFYDAAEKKAEENIKAIEDRWAAAIPKLDAALKKANEAFDKENAVLQRLIGERDQFVDQIKSGFRSFVNSLSFESSRASKQIVKETKRLANGITVTLERELEVGGGPAAIRQTLEERLAAVREFSRNIKTLMQRGLDPALVQDFVSAGVSGAGSAAAALASGSQEDIAAINAVQSQLLSESEDFGKYASAQWHDIGVAQQQAIVTPLEVARDAAQKALDDANVLRDKELAAAQAQLEKLRTDRKAALDKIDADYNAKKAELEAKATELQAQMDTVAAQIEEKILAMLNTTATRSAEAGMKAGQKLLEGFRKEYPKVYDKLNRLMDQLAASLTRTATVTVQTVYQAVMPVTPPPTGKLPKRAMGGPVAARTAYLVGERGPELFVPGFSGNIIPNNQLGTVPAMGARGGASGGMVVNLTVNAGMGANGDDIGRQVVDSLRRYERRNGPIPVKVAG